MNRNSRLLMVTLCSALCLIPTIDGMAQEADLWGIDADVDRDGFVNVADVQQVINRALGVTDTGREAIRLRVRQYVVAAPRATLVVVPPPEGGDGSACCQTVGAAYNFPRQQGQMIVQTGAAVVFRLSGDLEGVWYEDACGLLGTRLVVEARPLDGAEDTWVEIGRDEAGAKRCGPAAGRADVRVPHVFEEPGDYLVRARVGTLAIPANEDGTVTTEPLPACGALAYDEVLIGLRVLDPSVTPDDLTPDDLSWEDMPDPPMGPFGETMREQLNAPDMGMSGQNGPRN